jgi:hypothetical protein
MNWITGIVVIIILGLILEREIYFYEGVHAWLYDRWSRKVEVKSLSEC